MESAALQYAGENGITELCKRAVERFILCGDPITDAKIITFDNAHCLLLMIDDFMPVMVKAGFSSGYAGEGPSGLSHVLQLLYAHGVEIDECKVSKNLFDKINASALSEAEFKRIKRARPIRPMRWSNYVDESLVNWNKNEFLWHSLPHVLPLSIIDMRIIDLAITFWRAPDARLATAYRRLEDIIRARGGTKEHGAKLFSKVFNGDSPVLQWPGVEGGESSARAQLFVGAFGAFRNPRMHRIPKDTAESLLAEFLLVNQLFRLECEAVPSDNAAVPANKPLKRS